MLISFRELKRLRRRLKNKRIVIASGVFDLFHIGHLKYLKKAKALGDILFVNVIADKRVKFIKGEERPIITQKQRAQLINSLKFVDYVIVNPTVNKSSAVSVIRILQPDIFAVRTKEREKELLKACPTMKVVRIPETKFISTTKIIEKIKSVTK